MGLGYFIFALVLLACAIFIYLGVCERKLKLESERKRVDFRPAYRRELKKIIRLSEEGKKALGLIDSLASEIFREIYFIKGKQGYWDLEKKFHAKKMHLEESFSREMVLAMYSKEKVSKKQINSLVKYLEKMIS